MSREIPVGRPSVRQDGRPSVDVLQDHGLQHLPSPLAPGALGHKDLSSLPVTINIKCIESLPPANSSQHLGPAVTRRLALVVLSLAYTYQSKNLV